MTDLDFVSIGKNRLQFLRTGVGGHGAAPSSAADVSASLDGKFRFIEEAVGVDGLRAPQLGALHAVLAHRSKESSEPVTVVLPTGTGKTETMLAAFAYQPARTLVVVPSDALRNQIAEKFATLGVLTKFGVVSGQDIRCPVVALLQSGLSESAEVNALLDGANVVVATVAAINACGPNARSEIAAMCDRLFVDEAHHIAARSWQEVRELFDGKEVIQFTATPFREDGKHLGGRLVYSYPLSLAQKNGWFAKINYRGILDLGEPDTAIAQASVEQLRKDVANGLDHVLMARVRSIPRAEEVLEIYEDLAPDLGPLRIDSKMPHSKQLEAHAFLRQRSTRIVVCVDMLGEGFDLSALKVAAIHDPHKSLAVTLQFVGRFARVGADELGDASVFVPRQAGDIDDRLRRLYGEDADWNSVIRDLTETEVAKEQDRSDFESGFRSLPSEIAMKSLQPKMSTVVYRSASLKWHPDTVYDLFEEGELLTSPIGINHEHQVLWFVTDEREELRWGSFNTFAQNVYNLYIVHCDQEQGLLYINSSNNASVHSDLAEAVGGASAEIIKGDVVYRLLSQIKRRVPTNVGLLDAVSRNRRFSMHVGADVLEGFGPGAASKSKTNIFAHGYRNGERVSFGASRKGRVWSHRVAYSLLDWVSWVRQVGPILIDESISVADVMAGFIIPVAAIERPNLVPLGIEWPYSLIGNTSDARQVEFGGAAVPLLDLDLALTEWSDSGPIRFEVQSADWVAAYEVTFSDDGPVVSATAADATIHLARGSKSLSQFMTEQGISIFFEQEAVLSPDGYIVQPDRTRPSYPKEDLEALDWTGVNIKKESQGQERDPTSVQYRVIEHLLAESSWDIVIDDDGTGEVADVVLLRKTEQTLEVMLVHCKYSKSSSPGKRLQDLYEVCGQAVKSYKARSETQLVLRKLLRRETNRQSSGKNGFIVGDANDLVTLINEVRQLDVQVTITIAQPGLAKDQLTLPLAEVIGCTHAYLAETYNSQFRVFCS